MAAETKKMNGLITINFSPGALGIQGNLVKGEILGTSIGCQASQKGVKKGWIMNKINEKPYSLSLYNKTVCGAEYNITFCCPEDSGKVIAFLPGGIGIQGNLVGGNVFGVAKDSQAEKQCVKSGWTMTHINSQPYSLPLLEAKSNGSEKFTITFNLNNKKRKLSDISYQDTAEREHKKQKVEKSSNKE